MTYEITNKTKFIATCIVLASAIVLLICLLFYLLFFQKRKTQLSAPLSRKSNDERIKSDPEVAKKEDQAIKTEEIVKTEVQVINSVTNTAIKTEVQVINSVTNTVIKTEELEKFTADHLNSYIKKERELESKGTWLKIQYDKEFIDVSIKGISFDGNTKNWKFDIYDPKNQLKQVAKGVKTGFLVNDWAKRDTELFKDILDVNSLNDKDKAKDINRAKEIFTKIFSTGEVNERRDGFKSSITNDEMKELCKILDVVEPDIIIENEPEKNADNDKTYVDMTYTENILEAPIVSDAIAAATSTKDASLELYGFMHPIVKSKVEEVLENPKVKTGLGIAEKTFNFIEPKVTKVFEYPITTSIKVLTSLYNYDPTTKQVKEELELRKKSYLDSLNSFLKKQRNIEVEVEVDGALVKTVKIEKVLVSIVDIRFDEAKNEWTFKVNDPKNQLVDIIEANKSITEENPLRCVYKDADIAKDILDIDHLDNADEGQKNKLKQIFEKIFSKDKPTKYEDGTDGYESSITNDEMKELCEILKLLLPEIEAPTTEDVLRAASEYALSKGSELLEVEEALQDLKELTNRAITIFKYSADKGNALLEVATDKSKAVSEYTADQWNKLSKAASYVTTAVTKVTNGVLEALEEQREPREAEEVLTSEVTQEATQEATQEIATILTEYHLNGFFNKERNAEEKEWWVSNNKDYIEIKINKISFDASAKKWTFEISDPKNQINKVIQSKGNIKHTYRETDIGKDILSSEFIGDLESIEPGIGLRVSPIMTKILKEKTLSDDEMTELCAILRLSKPEQNAEMTNTLTTTVQLRKGSIQEQDPNTGMHIFD